MLAAMYKKIVTWLWSIMKPCKASHEVVVVTLEWHRMAHNLTLIASYMDDSLSINYPASSDDDPAPTVDDRSTLDI